MTSRAGSAGPWASRPDRRTGASPARIVLQRLLGRDPAVHDPHPVRTPVLVLNLGEKVRQRGVVGGVARHRPRRPRKAVRVSHQGDHHLHAIAALVAAVFRNWRLSSNGGSLSRTRCWSNRRAGCRNGALNIVVQRARKNEKNSCLCAVSLSRHRYNVLLAITRSHPSRSRNAAVNRTNGDEDANRCRGR